MENPTSAGQPLRPPKQRRSRDSLRRILAATRELLAGHGPEEVTLRGIASAANVSQSSLFARFRTKEALFDHLHAEICRERGELAERALGELEGRELELTELVQSMLRTFVEHLRADGALVASLARAGHQVPAILERERALRIRVAERSRETVLRWLPESAREAAAAFIDSQISVLMTSVPQLVEDGSSTLIGGDLSDDELVEQLSKLALRLARTAAPQSDPASEARKPAKAQASR